MKVRVVRFHPKKDTVWSARHKNQVFEVVAKTTDGYIINLGPIFGRPLVEGLVYKNKVEVVLEEPASTN